MLRLLHAAVLVSVALGLGPTSASFAAGPHPTVTLALTSGTTLSTAGTTRYTGTATSTPTGTPVYLEYRDRHGRWYNAAVTTTQAHGIYNDTFTSGFTGRTTFRVTLHPGKHYPGATSTTRTVTLSELFHLSDITPTASTATTTGAVTLGVNTYPNAITFIATAASEETAVEQWDLNGRCSLVTSAISYANRQQASPGARGDASIVLDGATAATAAVLPTDAGPVLAAPTRDTKTIQLKVDFAGKDTTSRIAWIDPRVLCTADPTH